MERTKEDHRYWYNWRKTHRYELIKAQEEQNGLCAICRKPENNIRNRRIMGLHIDHDHTTMEFRGLLCLRCNTGLGQFLEDPEILRAAATYLDNYYDSLRKRVVR
jgi:hypothetical protein